MDAESGNVLPRRTATRPRRGGRHRSPDRISVPDAAPALVLAVPAAQAPATAQLAAEVVAVAAGLCPGAAISAGYADDGPAGLRCVLAQIVGAHAAAVGEDGEAGPASGCAAVVVPLALTPDAASDGFVAAAAAAAGPAVMVAGRLGPHPVLGAALHDRLAEAGLVRPRRMSGLSLVTLDTAVLLAVGGGEDTLPAAEAAAIMLASRLGVPVAPASTGIPASIDGAAATLRRGGATRLVLAPYLIGPEISPDELAAAAAAAGAECAPPLGSHPAIGQLVTMSYGSALLQAGRPAPTGSPAVPGPAAAPEPASLPGPAASGLPRRAAATGSSVSAQPAWPATVQPEGPGRPEGPGEPEGQGSYRTTPPVTDERNLPWRTSTSR